LYKRVCLDVLNGNVKLTVCDTRKLHKHKAALRKVVERHVSLWQEETHITARGISAAFIERRPTDDH